MPVMVNNKWVIDQRKKACHIGREMGSKLHPRSIRCIQLMYLVVKIL